MATAYTRTWAQEKQVFAKFVVFLMLFVVATVNHIWTHSLRLLLFRLTNSGPSKFFRVVNA